MQALVGLIDLKIKFNCMMLKLPVRCPVEMRTQCIYEYVKEEKTVQSMLLKYIERMKMLY
jgi:hypothetical protein